MKQRKPAVHQIKSSSAGSPPEVNPCVVVIFGGSGDLCWRKLVPSLFNLFTDGRLPEKFALVAVNHREIPIKQFEQRLLQGVNQFSRKGKAKPAEWRKFLDYIQCLAGDFKDPAVYEQIKQTCQAFDKKWRLSANRIFHLAVPPPLFGDIANQLGKAGLSKDRTHSRLVVEKPIGYDLKSARALNKSFGKDFEESQIFRIDHYLGKETVQNLLAFRFGNTIFEPIWSRQHIDHVTITAAEQVGVENRGDYYDKAGALRDMVQNHLLQLVCLTAMEPMASFEAQELRDLKIEVLRAIRPIQKKDVAKLAVRGQYTSGKIDGKAVPSYRAEKGVKKNSKTETFAALKLFVDNWRWQNVPFYLRTGKCLEQHVSEIVIQFKRAPHQPFPKKDNRNWQPAKLTLTIQPNEAIVLQFQAKLPGPLMALKPVEMRFDYKTSFAVPSPDAYETLLWDVMNDDPTLFMREDQVEAAWSLLEPILEVWSKPAGLKFYKAGSEGPKAAEQLLNGH